MNLKSDHSEPLTILNPNSEDERDALAQDAGRCELWSSVPTFSLFCPPSPNGLALLERKF